MYATSEWFNSSSVGDTTCQQQSGRSRRGASLPANQRLSITTFCHSEGKINKCRPIREEDHLTVSFQNENKRVANNNFDFSVSKHNCLQHQVQFLSQEPARSLIISSSHSMHQPHQHISIVQPMTSYRMVCIYTIGAISLAKSRLRGAAVCRLRCICMVKQQCFEIRPEALKVKVLQVIGGNRFHRAGIAVENEFLHKSDGAYVC